MRSCGHCGDRYADTDVHNCWVLAKTWSQENLPAPTYEFATCRPIQSDADWRATHPKESSHA